jgi:Ca2+-binding EF-hand superfamily protein
VTENATSEYAATFNLVDADGDGRISAQELLRLMEVLGRPIPAEAADAAVARIDSDGDGRISLDEFAAYLSSAR